MKYALTFIGAIIFIYLIFSFGSAEINFIKWTGEVRGCCSFIMACGSIMSVVLHIGYDEDNKK